MFARLYLWDMAPGTREYGGNAKDLESFDYHFISGPKHMQKLRDLNTVLTYPITTKYVNSLC